MGGCLKYGFLTVDGYILGYLTLTVNTFGMVVTERATTSPYSQ